MKIITEVIIISYYLITLLVLFVLLTNGHLATGLLLWITYIGMIIVNIIGDIRKAEYERTIKKLQTELNNISKG